MSTNVQLDGEETAQHCRRVLSFEDLTLTEEYDYSCIPLCVIDAVFSMGVRYQGVQNVVQRVCDKLSIRKAKVENTEIGLSTSEFLHLVSKYSLDELVDNVFQNKQLTSTRNGILKAEASILYLKALQKHGIERFEDLYKLKNNLGFVEDIGKIPGQKSGISTSYFYMLAGNADLVKPDRMIVRFISAGLHREVQVQECHSILAEALKVLKADYPELNLKTLDNMIWRFQREQMPESESVKAKDILLNSLPWSPPEHIGKALTEIQKAIADLRLMHEQRKFTLDGRIVGDIGEIIVAHYFDVELMEKQQKGFDAKILSGPNKDKKVEIKCRMASETITFVSEPTFLIVIQMLEISHEIKLVYAGSGSVLSKIRQSLNIRQDRPLTVRLDQFQKYFDYVDYMKTHESQIPLTQAADCYIKAVNSP